ncbi:MAG TPA: AAA family ATPase [Prolixibacteraceae bacterium]|nr:AAA family ATPase [Prolixibacteraceae bacterium]
MEEIRKNPFKPNVIENNPSAFGLRSKEIIFSIESLFNDNSIFITGARGIGKSSLGLQLQKVLSGDDILLKRCYINRKLNGVLCIYYACASETSIEELCLDILCELEQELLLLPEIKLNKIKSTLELNFGIFKATFEGEIESRKRSPSSIANRFVNGIRSIYDKAVELGIFAGINIMIDEVDQLPESINFGHFVKIIHETLSNRNCNKVTFIFAGQLGSYSRFNKEDPSFERIVKCIPLDKLSWEASEYILDYALLVMR